MLWGRIRGEKCTGPPMRKIAMARGFAMAKKKKGRDKYWGSHGAFGQDALTSVGRAEGRCAAIRQPGPYFARVVLTPTTR